MTEPVTRPSGSSRAPRASGAPDVVIIGDGIIALAVALAAAQLGATCRVVGHPSDGSASRAAGGLLAPSLGTATPDVRAVFRAARDSYPAYIRWLAERTGIEVAFNRLGILEVASSEAALEQLTRQSPGAAVLTGIQAVGIEPPLVSAAGAVFHPDDGAVDNLRLLDAMQEAVRCEWAIESVIGRVVRLDWSGTQPVAITENGQRHVGKSIVLAAGAWSALIDGLPRALRLEPVRGQMLSLDAAPLRHVIAGPSCYLVPRGEQTIVGSTLERVGFDSATTPAALKHLRDAAVILCPALTDAPLAGSWAGLRPMTPDSLPVLGRDPDRPELLYACGHGKNGILLAPLTGECVSALLTGSPPRVDLRPFSVERFATASEPD